MTENVLRYRARGAVRQLWRVREWPKGLYQILLEGPAGTGKTRGLLEWVHWLCSTYANIRVLFLRETKGSLAESVLVTWEQEVLWPGHPCVTGTATAHNRQTYTFPNGSHIVLGGLKDTKQTDKTLSTQYDVVILFEGRQVLQFDRYQMLARQNRNWKIPWQLRIVDTNPGPEFHWANLHWAKPEQGGCFRSIPEEYWKAPPLTIKCEDLHVSVIPFEVGVPDEKGKVRYPCPVCGKPSPGAKMFRLLSRFPDNPRLWSLRNNTPTEEYLEYVEGNLALLKGAPRANLYEGRWCNEEGVIYEDWDPAVHIIDEVPKDVTWYFGSFDKGLAHPGCLQIWGVSGRKLYRVREIYRTGENIDWWAAQVARLDKEYSLQALVCDPSEPDYIIKFNDFLGERRGRDGGRIARKAMNAILTGIDLVRWGLSKRDDGPHMFFLRNALESVDRTLVERMKPTCWEQEVGGYIWQKTLAGFIVQKPDPKSSGVDNACDTTRYAAAFAWGRDLSPIIKPKGYDVDSFGSVLGHEEVMRASAESGW